MAPKTERRLTPTDWLEHALDTLLSEGIAGVRVEPLARALGVTTGSFYWHFKNREDFCRQLLTYWELEKAVATPEQLVVKSADARDRYLHLVQLVVRENHNRYDRAMRAWAGSDELAAAAVARVDRRRLETARGLFLEMGFDPEEADLRSRISYYALVGENNVLVDISDSARAELATLKHRLLTAPVDS